ncbi:MAG: DNA repair protein RadA [Chloroflexi bacterium]|nr:DNA repair protein RadA [Chloroflexota bacterium]
MGKCVTGDTRVLDPVSGEYLPITAWMTGRRPVLAVDEQTLRLRTATVAAFHERGVHAIVALKTALGRTLRCTPDHPVLTPEGWRPVGELAPGSAVAAPRSLPYFGNTPMPEAAIKLIAYILSDGPAQSAIGVTTSLPDVVEDLRYARANDKFVPDCIFRLPREQLALFVRTLFTCDGSVYLNRYGLPGVSYSTISRRLAEDVQHLLLRFGFVATLRTKNSRVNGRSYTSYEVFFLGIPEVQRFLTTIGILVAGHTNLDGGGLPVSCVMRHASFRQLSTIATYQYRCAVPPDRTAACEVIAGTGRNRRHDRSLRRTTVAQLADAFPDPWLQALAYGDVCWDEIVGVHPAGEAPVYDLTVPGEANFVANDLIVHNSTLLLQVAAAMAQPAAPVLYVSGEESVQQIKLRADRLGIRAPSLYLLAETSLEAIVEQIGALSPGLVVVDSIQTTYRSDLSSAAGSVGQVREGAAQLQRVAKATNVPIFIVGHVTKEGAIAGPRVLEHIVDTVLYLEGERFHTYRLLRCVKNRFGSVNEVGVFEMAATGLIEVANPSQAFLAGRLLSAAGSTVTVTLEGTRPLLVEIQALATPTTFGLPRRTANGLDLNRVLLLTAVLTKRVGLGLGNQDIFVNVVGGLKIAEPAADLAVAVAIAASFREMPVDPHLVVAGEVGLSGEVRTIGQVERRLAEAAKLGFRRCLLPQAAAGSHVPLPAGLALAAVGSIDEALEVALGRVD